MDLRQFRYFVAVAETLNFRRAAERLDMAQPPLSLAIKKLEDDLQVRLFDRTNRSVKLTAAGIAFLDEARQAIEKMEHAVAVARRAATSRPGSLRIGFPTSALFWLMPPIFKSFRESHPELDLEFFEADSSQMVEYVTADHVDIGFMRPITLIPDTLHVSVNLLEPLVLAVPTDHTLAGLERVPLASLADEPMVSFAPSTHEESIYQITMKACRAAGFSPNIVLSVGHRVESALGMVASGVGLALVPRTLQSVCLPGLSFRPLAAPNQLEVKLVGLCRKVEPSTALSRFIDFLKTDIKD